MNVTSDRLSNVPCVPRSPFFKLVFDRGLRETIACIGSERNVLTAGAQILWHRVSEESSALSDTIHVHFFFHERNVFMLVDSKLRVARKKRRGAQISRHMERLTDLRRRRRRLSRARRPAPVALADWATAAAAPSAGRARPWASRRAFQSSSESGATSRARGASVARAGRARASGPSPGDRRVSEAA